jgi:hypothetical protein
MKIGDLNAEVGENFFKLTLGNDSQHQDSKDNDAA